MPAPLFFLLGRAVLSPLTASSTASTAFNPSNRPHRPRSPPCLRAGFSRACRRSQAALSTKPPDLHLVPLISAHPTENLAPGRLAVADSGQAYANRSASSLYFCTQSSTPCPYPALPPIFVAATLPPAARIRQAAHPRLAFLKSQPPRHLRPSTRNKVQNPVHPSTIPVDPVTAPLSSSSFAQVLPRPSLRQQTRSCSTSVSFNNSLW